MTIVRIVPWPGGVPDGGALTGHLLVVLADEEVTDDGACRAAPLWLQVSGGKSLRRLLDRPSGPGEVADVLQETAARLLEAAGVRVTGVDLEPVGENVPQLRSDTVTARVALATTAGARQVLVTAGYGVALAAAAGAPVRVADELMDQFAVPVPAGDVLAPFLPAPAVRTPDGRVQRRRFEPRNLGFTDDLDRWELAGSFLGAGQPHWQDYSCTVADGAAALASAVPDPFGFALLVQTIYADDYRGSTVTFRGELRTTRVVGVTGAAVGAGLYLAAGRPDEPAGAQLGGGGSSGSGGNLTRSGSSDWSWHEVTALVPRDAGIVRFGVSLAGRGRIELRSAELTASWPEGAE
jgi:hypothetical protein